MKKFYLFLFYLVCLNFGYSQTTIVAIDRNNETGPTATYAVSDISARGFERGDGIEQAGVEDKNTFKTKKWNATTQSEAETNQEYIEWSVTADANFSTSISELRIRLNRNVGGPQNFIILYSLDGFNSSIPVISAQSLATPSAVNFVFNGLNINSTFGGTITFRLYGWGATNVDNGQLLIAGKKSWGLPGLLPNPGSILRGMVNFDGLKFIAGNWSPNAPSSSTGTQNALLLSGTYTINSDIALNDIKIESNAKVTISSTGNLLVNGNLTNLGTMTLTSSSVRYPSLLVDGTVNGNVTYSRHVNLNSSVGGNDLVAAPVTGQNFNQFLALNGNIVSNGDNSKHLFGPFDKVTGTYVTWATNETTQLDAATGYRAATTDNGNLVFKGAVNTGTINKNILFGGPTFMEWNLIGNPYTSYLTTSNFLGANINQFNPLRAAIYGYDGDASDGWIIWNLAYLTTHPNALITPGQGFFVASKANGGTISFTPNMRTTGTNDDFIAGKNFIDDNVGFLKINIYNGTKNHNTSIYFNDQSTKGLDIGYDASVFGSSAPAFSVYTHLVENNTGVDMAVQSLAYTDLTTELNIPLGIKASKGQRIVVSIAESILPEGTDIYLEDNLNNTFTILNTSDYTFTVNSNLTDTGRFFLHTVNKKLSVQDNDFNGLQIYATIATKSLFVKGLIKENTSLTVFDIQGRSIRHIQLDANTNSNQMDLSNLNSGVYIVKLKNNTQEKTQKIILK